MRVLVPGGYGNFGARICRALARAPGIEVVATGRDPERGARAAGFDSTIFNSTIRSARLDLDAADFAEQLRALAPDLVVHCAGPFQGQDYRVARAALAAGAHYIDLADGRDFVARFAGEIDSEARKANRLALSGASSVPALSSAVVDRLRGRFRELHVIRIAIAPGQHAPRGRATMAAVFGYAGRPFKWLQDGVWVDAHGWQKLARVHHAGVGTRWAAACDVPDLELFPSRYPDVHTVEFRAALELRTQHLALYLAAALRRAGLPLPIERWAGTLDRLSSWLDVLGSDRGGMLVSLEGLREDGRPGKVGWHLTAPSNHGPEIPCMAAILLAGKLARGAIEQRGAFPCMGFLALEEFAPEFERWGITFRIVETDA